MQRREFILGFSSDEIRGCVGEFFTRIDGY